MARFGWLYLRFNRDFYYWETIMMIRKLLIVLLQTGLKTNPPLQADCSIAVVTIFFVATVRSRPFVCYSCLKQRKKRCKHMSSNDNMEAGSLFATAMMLGLGKISLKVANAKDKCKDNAEAVGLSLEKYADEHPDCKQDDETMMVLGVLMVMILVLASVYIGRILFTAWREQKREQAKMKKAGIGMSDQESINKMQGSMSRLSGM
jgi:hypothetical protein